MTNRKRARFGVNSTKYNVKFFDITKGNPTGKKLCSMFVVRSEVMWKYGDKFTFISSKNVSCGFCMFIYFRNASWNSRNRLGILQILNWALNTEHSFTLFILPVWWLPLSILIGFAIFYIFGVLFDSVTIHL